MNKRIGICHYRIGGTDGVSFEIEKHKSALEMLGYAVKLISGPKQVGADYIIPELGLDRPDVYKIKKNAFLEYRDYESEAALKEEIERIAAVIEECFLEIHKKEKFDYLFLHNIFSHARHIAAAKSFYDALKSTHIQGIAVDHDFYQSYGDLYSPTVPYVQNYLDQYVPPKSPRIRHVTISSIGRELLYQKTGLDSLIIPNTFDFDQPMWVKDEYNRTFLADIGVGENDLIVLQATRIVERKAVELAIDVVKRLQDNKERLVGKMLYNRKKILPNADVVLLLAGYTEPASGDYEKELRNEIERQGIKAKFISDKIGAERRWAKDRSKIYSLWDAYVYADLVTYPSVWEGWGNQFIEAIFAKKPIVVFEYPVFRADIKGEGYQIISLGQKIAGLRDGNLVYINSSQIMAAAEAVEEILTSRGTEEMLEQNFKIGKQYHGRQVLSRLLEKDLFKTHPKG